MTLPLQAKRLLQQFWKSTEVWFKKQRPLLQNKLLQKHYYFSAFPCSFQSRVRSTQAASQLNCDIYILCFGNIVQSKSCLALQLNSSAAAAAAFEKAAKCAFWGLFFHAPTAGSFAQFAFPTIGYAACSNSTSLASFELSPNAVAARLFSGSSPVSAKDVEARL